MKKTLGFYLFIVTAFICAGFFSACQRQQRPAAEAEVFNLRLAHLSPETEVYHTSSVKFKELIEERSNGRINVTIFPAGQLGYDREIIESLQLGVIDLGVVTTAPLANFAPAFGVFDLPWIFRDWDHVESVIRQPFIQDLYATAFDRGLVVMAMLPRGFRNTTNSIRPLNSADDFRGIRMRVLESPIYVNTFEALGANVTAMSWGEVFTALQQGAIDAVEQPNSALFNERIFEVQSYLTFTEHIFAFASFAASRSLYDRLPGDLQELMRECAVEALYLTGVQARLEGDSFGQRLQDMGMIANHIDKVNLRRLVQRTYDDFISRSDQQTIEFLNHIERTN